MKKCTLSLCNSGNNFAAIDRYHTDSGGGEERKRKEKAKLSSSSIPRQLKSGLRLAPVTTVCGIGRKWERGDFNKDLVGHGIENTGFWEMVL